MMAHLPDFPFLVLEIDNDYHEGDYLGAEGYSTLEDAYEYARSEKGRVVVAVLHRVKEPVSRHCSQIDCRRYSLRQGEWIKCAECGYVYCRTHANVCECSGVAQNAALRAAEKSLAQLRGAYEAQKELNTASETLTRMDERIRRAIGSDS